jgi:hypothetical protein
LCGALCGCGDAKFTPHGDMAGTMKDGGGNGSDSGIGAGDLAMSGGMVPDPGNGNAVDQDFGDVEPNDTPAQATPLGISQDTMGVYAWVGGNSLGGTDTADYFVFKSTSAGPFTMNACSTPGLTNLNATIWKVQNGQQVNPPIHMWTGVNGCITVQPTDAVLEANTVYLLGIFPVGNAGMYSA